MDTVLLRHQRHSGMAAENLQQDLLIPKKQLTVSLIFNGMPGEPKHDRRLKRTLSAVYDAVSS
jgi:hypothetical protein